MFINNNTYNIFIYTCTKNKEYIDAINKMIHKIPNKTKICPPCNNTITYNVNMNDDIFKQFLEYIKPTQIKQVEDSQLKTQHSLKYQQIQFLS